MDKIFGLVSRFDQFAKTATIERPDVSAVDSKTGLKRNEGRHESKIKNRMDGCNVESSQGLHESKPGLQELLRRNVCGTVPGRS